MGRPRDPSLDLAILTAAESQLRERGYGVMSIESVARAARTTVPSLRRRYRDKPALAFAVIDSMRITQLKRDDGTPRKRALAILENFHRNLSRPHSMALLGSLLAEEGHHPELIERFRDRLVKPRRAMLAEAIAAGIRAGELAEETDVDATVSLLIGSYYAHYVSRGRIPKAWSGRILSQLWPLP